jgi:hypothetical protein
MKNIGSLSIHKGPMGQFHLKLWDALPICDASCPLFEEQCPYDKTKRICDLRKTYVENVMSSLYKAVEEKDEMMMHRVGMLLIPLYTSLISIKLDIHAMNGRVSDSKGRVNGIYRELRETIKTIDAFLKDLGIDKVKGASKNGKGDLLNGNGSYYEDLLNEGKVPV